MDRAFSRSLLGRVNVLRVRAWGEGENEERLESDADRLGEIEPEIGHIPEVWMWVKCVDWYAVHDDEMKDSGKKESEKYIYDASKN